MIGVVANTAAVIVGSLIGMLFSKAIPKRVIESIMTGIGLCVIYIGISGALQGKNTLVMIISMVLGSAAGTLLDLDGAIKRLGGFIQGRFARNGEPSQIAEGFVTGSLLFCVGAMTIVGSLNAGLNNDYQLLFTKSLLDLISALLLSVSLGVGVMFSASFVFVIEGSLVLLSGVLRPLLADGAITEIVSSGSLIILALGLNLIGVSKLKVANYLPAILFAPIVYAIASSL